MREYFLTSERIGFSKWQGADKKLALSLWGDPEVTRFISVNGFTEQQVYERLTKEIENERLYGIQYWPLFLLDTEEFIGCCGLRTFDSVSGDLDNGVYELGFHLKREYWGSGYAGEAAKAVIGYAFDVLHADNLFAGHHPQNLASKNLLLKLGFKYRNDLFYPPTGLNHPAYYII